MIHVKVRATLVAVLMACFLVISTGCFSEQSFPMRHGDYVRLSSHGDVADDPASTREWLRSAHQELHHLLPRRRPKALLTEDLLDAQGRPIDVLQHFHVNRDTLESLVGNCKGLEHSAQLTGPDFNPNRPPTTLPGCEDVWIPVGDDLSLHGLLCYARDEHGEFRDADCIVLLPGLLGHNGSRRTRDLTAALVGAGLHVLAIELRSHGQTGVKYPDVYYNFCTIETRDLMIVSEWLQSRPHIRRTGLIGYCWGANQALLAAWFDGRSESHPSLTPGMASALGPVSAARHYEAGIMAFSPVLRFEEIIDALDTERSIFVNPVLTNLQATVQSRVVEKSHDKFPGFDPRACAGSLRKLIDYEIQRSEIYYPGCVEDTFRMNRFLPYKDKPDGEKLASARVPVLIVQAANDPLACAQDVAVLIAKTPNPHVAAIVLPGGGHVGFAAYARAYYFSLILNFFQRHPDPDGPTLH
ncbi:MAG TPA: alpha/beta fold hydrolase [Phycisphaerae bacterium]|nr:alpha/beta fold hydrolase [Phycisphaerae bacterium]